MLQTETKESRKGLFDAYQAKYLINRELEWLIEEGKIRESIYFKGATGDRYTIYIATKRNTNIIDFSTVYNSYGHGTELGTHIATLRGYVLTMYERSNTWSYRNNYYGLGYTFKQMMRQGVMSEKYPWTIRYCRSSHFVKLNDKAVSKGETIEFTPWCKMQMNIKDGTLINKPNRISMKHYHVAKERDRKARKANRIANKNNRDANARYLKANGNYALLPIDDIFKLRNTDRRNDIMNFYGLEKILATLETKVVDEDTIDGRLYRLIDVKIPDLASGQERHDWGLYLEMLNPSTGESHFEGIANTSNNRSWSGGGNIKEATVKAALSWRDGDGIIQSGKTWSATSSSENYVVPIKLT